MAAATISPLTPESQTKLSHIFFLPTSLAASIVRFLHHRPILRRIIPILFSIALKKFSSLFLILGTSLALGRDDNHLLEQTPLSTIYCPSASASAKSRSKLSSWPWPFRLACYLVSRYRLVSQFRYNKRWLPEISSTPPAPSRPRRTSDDMLRYPPRMVTTIPLEPPVLYHHHRRRHGSSTTNPPTSSSSNRQ